MNIDMWKKGEGGLEFDPEMQKVLDGPKRKEKEPFLLKDSTTRVSVVEESCELKSYDFNCVLGENEDNSQFF